MAGRAVGTRNCAVETVSIAYQTYFARTEVLGNMAGSAVCVNFATV